MEHKVKSYTRRLKNGKTITVKAHTRKGKDGVSDEDAPKKRRGAGSEVLSLKERRLAYKERPNPKDMSDDEVMAEWDQIHEEYRNDRKNGVQSGAYARIKRLSNRANKILENRYMRDGDPSWFTENDPVLRSKKGKTEKPKTLRERQRDYKSRPAPKTMSDKDIVREYHQVQKEYSEDRKKGISSGAYARLQRLQSRALKIIWGQIDNNLNGILNHCYRG